MVISASRVEVLPIKYELKLPSEAMPGLLPFRYSRYKQWSIVVSRTLAKCRRDSAYHALSQELIQKPGVPELIFKGSPHNLLILINHLPWMDIR